MNSYSKQSKAGQAGSWLRALLALAFVTLMLLASGAARAATETITYIHPDISGSPLAATNDAGDLVWRESYRAYGQRQLNASASAQHSQWFHGKEQDAGTGLQYFGARYYDPAVGRFLGMDPVDYQDGNAHSFNRYAYGNNNPVRYLDPDGNHPVLAVGAVVFARMAVWLGTRQMAAITAAEAGAMIAAGAAGPGIAGVEAVAAKAAGAAAKGAENSFSVITSAPVSGTTRSAHRASANADLAAALRADPAYAARMNKELGTDVLGQMQSGNGGLRNPPGTEWHHPKSDPNSMWLLKDNVHRSPSLQDYLHGGGSGGFADYYGR